MPPKVSSGADGLPAVRDKGEQKEGSRGGVGGMATACNLPLKFICERPKAFS